MVGVPRALTPLRHPAYRLLAASMALSLLSSGLWIVSLVWQVVALDGGPAQLSVVAGVSAVRSPTGSRSGTSCWPSRSCRRPPSRWSPSCP